MAFINPVIKFTQYAPLFTTVSDRSGFHKSGYENVSVLTVLHAVFGFARIFSVFRFWMIFFCGFAVSNWPQCPPLSMLMLNSESMVLLRLKHKILCS